MSGHSQCVVHNHDPMEVYPHLCEETNFKDVMHHNFKVHPTEPEALQKESTN